MNYENFVTQVVNSFPVGIVIKNPAKGTSLILINNGIKISYKRGKSTISVKLIDLFEAYIKFKGIQLTTRELKIFKPEVFDSSARPAGHSCNCTILFRVLEGLQLCDPIMGAGVRGNPFSVKINS